LVCPNAVSAGSAARKCRRVWLVMKAASQVDSGLSGRIVRL
jgi:hypothetical protein